MIALISMRTTACVLLAGLLAGFGAGHHYGSVEAAAEVLTAKSVASQTVAKAEKAVVDLKAAYERRDSAARAAVMAKALADQHAADAIAAKSALQARARQVQLNNLTKENHDVQITMAALGRPTYFVADGWLRQYNSALAAGATQAPGAAGESAPATGRADADSSQVSEWDVLQNHTENAAKWSACRAQVKELIQFIDTTN